MQRKTGQQPCAFVGQTFLSVRLGFSGGYTGASAALRELFSVSNPAHRVKKRAGTSWTYGINTSVLNEREAGS
jgi:hypothetical protein